MTDEEESHHLTGWIRLVPGDGFGIALFSTGKNAIYIAETDDSLLITRFHAFYNEEGYAIDYDLPAGHKSRVYSIGDGSPIPFSAGGLPGVADTDAGSEALLVAHGAQIDEGVVGTVARVILQAETGAFERESLGRRIRNFERRHKMVFLEGAVHSRYWIEQYELAARELSVVSANESSFLRERLRLLGSEWLSRHYSSGELQLGIQMLGIAEDHQLLSNEEAKYGYYNFFGNKIGRHEFDGVVTSLGLIGKKVPEGLYYYELSIASDPVYNFRLRTSSDRDFLAVMHHLLDSGERRRELKLASGVSRALFGDHGPPPDIHKKALQIASRFVKVIEQGANSYQGRPPKGLRKSLLSAYRALHSIRELLDWGGKARRWANGSWSEWRGHMVTSSMARDREIKW